MHACLTALLLLLSLSPLVGAQASSVFWEKGLATALERARRLQRPILAAIHAPGNKASEVFLDKTYKDPAVRRLLREYVCVVGTEKPFPKIKEGARKGMSQAFLTVSFAEARKVEMDLRKRYLGSGELALPQHLILDSGGHLVDRSVDPLTAKELANFLGKGLDRVSPGWNPNPETPAGKPTKNVQLLPTSLLFTGTEEQKAQLLDQLLESDARIALLELYPKIKSEDTKVLVLSKIRFSKGDLSWQEPLLLGALRDKSAVVRANAAVNAAGVGLPGLAPVLLKAAKKEKVADNAKELDIETLSELVRALAACGKNHRATRKWLFALEKHRNSGIRKVFYVSMASWAKDSKEKKLRSLLLTEGLHDADWAVRSAAIWTLAEIRSKKAVSDIKRMQARTTRPWRKAFYPLALARIQGQKPDPEAWEKARVLLTGEKIPRPGTSSD